VQSRKLGRWTSRNYAAEQNHSDIEEAQGCEQGRSFSEQGRYLKNYDHREIPPGEVGSRSVHPSPGTIRQNKRAVNPPAEARHAASPVLGPQRAQNVQQNESSMSGSFFEKYFRLSRRQVPQDRQDHDQQHGKDGSAPDPVHSMTSYSKATPSGSLSSNHSSAARAVANTLTWSISPTSFLVST
jgi:hypothetical protein